jgi:iron(III) transport system permease protein
MTRLALALVALVLALPVLVVISAWAALDAAALSTLGHMAGTVLPDYLANTAVLAVVVGVGVTVVGAGTAVAVTLFDFPGRRSFEWLLLLPLAMPAYVLAYAYTDMLQFSGPLQSGLRAWLGVQDALWPDVRGLAGACALFVLCLYPYVYLLTRTALAERGVRMMEAARMLGAGTRRRIVDVALPLARPAIAAGVALALMETLADYGVGSYFGLTTFSTGIYKAWLSMNDRVAASMLASMLLALVALLLAVEKRAQRRLRSSSQRGNAIPIDAQPAPLRGAAAALAFVACALPVALGFVLPVAWLAKLVADEAAHAPLGLPLARFAAWSATSFKFAAISAVAATAFALMLAFAKRTAAPAGGRGLRESKHAVVSAASSLVSLGYAVPGAVIAIGVLVPMAWLQARWPSVGWGAAMTGTMVAVVYAYLVRFTAVAMQSIDAGYARVSLAVDDTARTLGARPLRVLRELHLPMLTRSLVAAALLVFVDVMKELPATLVLRPFDQDTLAVVAYNLARDERLAEAALPSLAIVAVGLIPVVMLSRVLRASKRPATHVPSLSAGTLAPQLPARGGR